MPPSHGFWLAEFRKHLPSNPLGVFWRDCLGKPRLPHPRNAHAFLRKFNVGKMSSNRSEIGDPARFSTMLHNLFGVIAQGGWKHDFRETLEKPVPDDIKIEHCPAKNDVIFQRRAGDILNHIGFPNPLQFSPNFINVVIMQNLGAGRFCD